MNERRVLILSPHQLSAFVWKGGEVRSEAGFENSPAGLAAFRDYLQARGNSVFQLLVNIAEEGFQLETIPFLQGKDRQSVLTRKLSQLFYTTPFTAATSLGFEKTRRKDERLLLSAITGAAVIEPWTQLLRETRVALSGIHSLPFVGATLLRKLGIGDECCVLLTQQDQTIRETYFEKGALHFSRLSPLTNTSIAGIAQSFASEALKLQQYLLSQRMVARNQPLKVVVIAHPLAMKAVETSCISTETLQFDIFGSDACAAKIGLKTPPPDSHAEAIFVHLLATSAPRTQYAPEPLLHDYRLLQIRRALLGAGTIALVACLLFTGRQWHRTFDEVAQAQVIEAEALTARQRYEDIARTFPAIPANNETLRWIIARQQELERGGTSPEPLYRDLSAALGKVPAVDLDAIEWKSGNVPASPNGSGAPAAALAGANAGPGPQSAAVRGTVNLGGKATPRQVLATFNQFVEALAANPRLTVKVTQQPFDIESGKALKSSADSTAETASRPFALLITRKDEP